MEATRAAQVKEVKELFTCSEAKHSIYFLCFTYLHLYYSSQQKDVMLKSSNKDLHMHNEIKGFGFRINGYELWCRT